MLNTLFPLHKPDFTPQRSLMSKQAARFRRIPKRKIPLDRTQEVSS